MRSHELLTLWCALLVLSGTLQPKGKGENSTQDALCLSDTQPLNQELAPMSSIILQTCLLSAMLFRQVSTAAALLVHMTPSAPRPQYKYMGTRLVYLRDRLLHNGCIRAHSNLVEVALCNSATLVGTTPVSLCTPNMYQLVVH